jgi:pilus assembly protein CpaC
MRALILALAASCVAFAPAAAQMTALPPRAPVVSDAAPVSITTTRALPIVLNKSRALQLPGGVSDIIVANPQVADIVVRTPGLAYILGKQVGETNVVFIDGAGRQVGSIDVSVTVDVDAMQTALRRAFPAEQIELVPANQAVALRGAVATPAVADAVRQLARQFVANDGQIVNMLRVGSEQQVLLRVRVAEVSREIVKQLGLNASVSTPGSDLALSIGRALVNPTPFASIAGTLMLNTFDRLTMTLEALERTGLVKTLAEPNVTAISGENASFLVGGEFPIPVPQDGDTITIQFKQFGIRLIFTPVVLGPNLISLKIGTEVSQLSDEGAITLASFRVPALSVRRAETTVEMPSGGSLVIAGLLQNNINSQVEGLPALKDVPLLGALFRSTKFQRNETELVITVAPVLARPVDSAALALPTDGFGASNDVNLFLFQRLHALYRGGRAPDGVIRGPAGFVLE